MDEFSLNIINEFECDKVLDIGNISQLAKLQDRQILLLKNKMEILQLNERVLPYLKQNLGCANILDIYEFFQPKLVIVTHEREGAEFAFKDTSYVKKIINSANELDATGAGDAFLSVFTKRYYDNLKKVNQEFIDSTFREAVTLTSKVVQNVGARGHLYEKTLDKEIQRRISKKEGIEQEL